MRNFENAKRIVVKIGTNILTKDAGVDEAYVRRVAGQVNSLLKDGRQVVIISSGAIGMGLGQLDAERARNIKMRQACAAIGQPLLMAEYRKSFLRYGVTVAQVLLTAEVLNHRKTYLNLRNSIDTLLKPHPDSAGTDNNNLPAVLEQRIHLPGHPTNIRLI
ncbi:MAG: hypothetical protein U9Q07_01105, partial [Planctomycetota bacterium]|nr:hypothetical protein [Planctomycetota bacterium]